MKNLERITKELLELATEGAKLLQDGQKDDMSLGDFGPRYETWYTKALSAVSQIIPERLPEFKEAYRHEKRKEVSYDTYAVSDFLLGLQVTRGGSPVFNTKSAFAVKLLRQVGIVNAATHTALLFYEISAPHFAPNYWIPTCMQRVTCLKPLI